MDKKDVMEMPSLENKLSQDIETIFEFYDMSSLSSYEKREIIFNYLTESIEYDYDFLERIREREINKENVNLSRNPAQELLDVIYYKKGVCNGISQYYKLLLEQVGIKSFCVICDDGTEVNHQLNLVYEEKTDSYSFDDVTSVIVGRGTKSDFFDYDVAHANKLNQGNKDIFHGENFFLLPETYVDYLIGRSKVISPMIKIPDNVASHKKQTPVTDNIHK